MPAQKKKTVLKKKTISKKKTAAKKKTVSKKKKAAEKKEEFPPREYYNLISEAYSKLDSPKRKEKLEAVQMMTMAVNMAPEETHGLFQRGQAFERLERYTEALADYQKCISIDPKGVSYYEMSATVMEKLGLLEDAISFMQKARKLIQYPYQLEYIRRFRDRLKKMQEDCSSVNEKISKDPENAIYYHERGQILNDMGEHWSAIRDFEKALELNPKFTDAETELGVCLFMVKLFEESEIRLSSVLEKEPENLIAVMMRGFARKELEKYSDALNDLKKTLSLDPGNEMVKKDITELEKKTDRSKKRKSGS